MSDEASEQTEQQPAEADVKESKDFEPITSQEDFEKRLGTRLQRERAKFADYDDVKAKAGKFDQLEQQKKTELERVAEERDSHKTRAQEAELARDRLEIALEKGLTKTQAKRLVGSTREELEADADELLADLAPSKPKAPRPNPAQSGGEATPHGDWLRAKFATS